MMFKVYDKNGKFLEFDTYMLNKGVWSYGSGGELQGIFYGLLLSCFMFGSIIFLVN